MSKKKRRRSPLGWISDGALRTVGFRHWEGLAGQPIPPHFAVKSIVLMGTLGIGVGFLFLTALTIAVSLSQRYILITAEMAFIFTAACGILAATMQAIRIACLNRKMRRHRIDVLERKANRELVIL